MIMADACFSGAMTSCVREREKGKILDFGKISRVLLERHFH